MKRSLGCHSNRGEESPCGTTVTGPRWAAHPFRALRCRSVVWKHEHQITSHLADWYPSITNLIKQILFLKCLFLFSPFLFSCSLTPPLLPSSFIFSPSPIKACLCQCRGETAKWLIQLSHVTSGTNRYWSGPRSFPHRSIMKPLTPAAYIHSYIHAHEPPHALQS